MEQNREYRRLMQDFTLLVREVKSIILHCQSTLIFVTSNDQKRAIIEIQAFAINRLVEIGYNLVNLMPDDVTLKGLIADLARQSDEINEAIDSYKNK